MTARFHTRNYTTLTDATQRDNRNHCSRGRSRVCSDFVYRAIFAGVCFLRNEPWGLHSRPYLTVPPACGGAGALDFQRVERLKWSLF